MFYRAKTLLAVCAAALLAAAPAGAQTPRSMVQHAQREAAVAPPASPLERLVEMGRARVQNAAAKTNLSTPYGLTLDSAGNLYAANLFGGVAIFNAKWQYQGAITTGVSLPAAVGVNFEGNIFVANNASNTISVYNPAWQQIGTISDPNLFSPSNLYVDSDDTVWVLDAQGAVHAYLADYTPLPPSTPTGGTALGPWGSHMTVWGIINDAGGYSEDVGNRGEMVRNNPSFPLFFPSGSPLAGGETQDAYGQQYVTDFANNQVQIWSSNGEYMTGLITTPAAPTGIAVDTARNRIYVALPNVNEIVVYSRVAPFKQLAVIH